MVRSRRIIAFMVMLAAVCSGFSGRVSADVEGESAAGGQAYAHPFDAIPTAAPELLAVMRGGLRVGGLDMEFAANVRTLVNGTLVLESTTNLTPGGTTTQSTMPTVGLDPQTLSFVSGQGGAPSGALPATLAGLGGQTGVVVEDPSGLTTALHSVTREQILGVVFTSASNQQIRQEINVEVTVANFGRFQESARNALFNGRLLGSLNFAQ
ncbi:hypothetical protein [Pelagibius sp. 7325]|uniref:hypothetical protein n=1 Tax=Pelagibius sp. 7325 TaxID=3131994 RepID=UPI0030EC2F25